MATIRKDVVQIGFDIDFGDFSKLTKGIEGLQKSVASGVGEDAFSELGSEAKRAGDSVKGVKDTVKGIRPDGVDDTADGLKETASQAKKAHEKIKPIASETFGKTISGLKKLSSTLGTVGIKAGKALAGGIAAGAAGVGAIVSQSVQEYANYEQLVGGVDTLFKDSSQTVQNYAANAFRTSGLSANDYMETVTSFSASLIQSLGGDTAAAAELAHTAIVGMSDNANKMGTDMGSIQNAYQGFAKQNYTMLDNLKLGYGGTQEEMKRLIKDASKMTDVQKKLGITVDGSSMSFANIINAISVVQESLGIAGTTSLEAEGTISGSLASVKAAWSNTLTALVVGGDSFDDCLDNLINSISSFGGNMMPTTLKALDGVGVLIEKAGPVIEENLPTLVDSLLPPFIKAATALFAGVLKALPGIAQAIAKEIPGILQTIFDTLNETFGLKFPAFDKIVEFFKENTPKVAKFIPVLFGLVGAFKALSALKSAGGLFSGLFGGGKGGSGKKGGLFDSFKELAKMKTTSVLKGMANLAIIIGGLMLLATAFAFFAPLIASLSDMKSLGETFLIVATLGIAGIAMAKPMAAVGMIKVSKVALGLANIAIVLVGLTALAAAFAYFAPFIAQLSDMKLILKVVAIMGILGVLGTTLAVFAGIAGMIPIGVVLTGLANIALALGGFTAIVAAYGALGQIPGFNDFISTGGDVLANLFGQLGKIVGSIIGGIGEGLTDSLPAIGENLSKFAESIAPMMTTFSGTDVSGVGAFLGALGEFILLASGEKLLSFITGGVDYAELGNQLTSFGENASGFFKTVANYPENGFTNATLLFDCLAGLKSLPKEGGVVGWFTGSINYETLANGLAQLSSEKVTGFFNTVSGLKQTGFDNATALFDCLAGLKSLPKDGGVVGWFCGEVDYTSIATGLGALSSDDVKKFFTMVGALRPAAFENAKLFFDSLASIGDLPKDGGFWDKLTGSETSALGNIAAELSKFGENTQAFFTQVNSLNLGKLNGLWESLKESESVTAKVSQIVDEHITDIVNKISKLPIRMGEGLKSSGESLATALVQVWKDAVNASAPHVNKVLDAANWILKEFGSSKRVVTWTPYAKGTDGHPGGNALVNDGRGAELVQMPNGSMFLPSGRNVLIPNAPKGMKVLSAEQTAHLMGRSTPTFRYASGTGDIDIWSYIDNASGLVSKIISGISYKNMTTLASSVARGFISTVKTPMGAWATKLFSEAGALGIGDYVASKGVSQWRSTVVRALKMEGLYSAANVQRTLYQMQTESGGNPRAINLWDSNAKKGIPSKGLMQVIDPTFRAYARAGYNKNIYDPLSNILASVRYAVSRYGSLAKAFKGKGYANGGIATSPSIFGEDGAEMAIPLSRSKRNRGLSLWAKTGDMLGMSGYSPDSDSASGSVAHVENNSYSPTFNLTLNGTVDRTTERTVKQWIQEALEDTFDSMSRTNPRVTEV